MMITRKRFLQIAGISALAGAGERLANRVARATENTPTPAQENPQKGRWGMVIDVSRCLQKEGCTRCIDACHLCHNVPHFSAEAHRIQWIWKTSYHQAFPSDDNEYQVSMLKNAPVPVLCNHCENPPCVRVCPTKATWKRQDGIVMMDWHRCIGCRYCMAACPYGSRSFNWTDPRTALSTLNPDFPTRTKGVVEKCNFCEERIAKGEMPACVKACPQEAMFFGELEDANSVVRELLRTRYTIRRKPELGTNPQIYYIV
jgi:Fe-S-cluster-containing dehydrogenase component